MSNETPPGGLSATDFKIAALDAGEWLWGMVQGSFNQKASLSQIIVDAVIGMIPLVGDVTAVRDLIAVSMRLIDDHEARENKWEWVLFVVLLIALIPVVGGVVKGVGRLIIKAAGESGKIANAVAKTAHFAEAAKEMIAFLNRVGHGHAEKWLLQLKFAEHEAAVMKHFGEFMQAMTNALTTIETKLGPVLSGAIRQRIAGLKNGIKQIEKLGETKLAIAIKELDAKLREIQQFIRSGGETTSRATAHAAASGDKAAVHLAEEAKLLEGAGAKLSRMVGLEQNVAKVGEEAKFGHIYTHEPGYPNLKSRIDNQSYSFIQAYAGKIVNRELQEGEQIYRLFGPPGTTRGHFVGPDPAYAGGKWWGLGAPPKNAKEWRMKSAVKDEWNRDGYIVVGTVPKGANPKACTGAISEQFGKSLPGQYLPGGGKQAYMEFERVQGDALQKIANEVIKTQVPAKWVDAVTGMHFEIRPTGWEDANGLWGYVRLPGAGEVQTSRLAAREMETKDSRDNQGGKK
jgi:nitrate reductase NapE component